MLDDMDVAAGGDDVDVDAGMADCFVEELAAAWSSSSKAAKAAKLTTTARPVAAFADAAPAAADTAGAADAVAAAGAWAPATDNLDGLPHLSLLLHDNPPLPRQRGTGERSGEQPRALLCAPAAT
jgi:hypothetical protein